MSDMKTYEISASDTLELMRTGSMFLIDEHGNDFMVCEENVNKEGLKAEQNNKGR